VEPAAGSGAAHVRAAAEVGQDVRLPRRSVLTRLLDRAKALLAWWQGTRAARANARFGAQGGGVLTGGIAYAALFSVFAALTIGWTAFMAVLGGDDELRGQVVDAINDAVPGLLSTGSSDGLVDPDSLRLSSGLTVAGVVAFVVLLLSALSATAALRTGVRAMFDAEGGGNMVLGKLRELGGLAGLALAILLSAVLTTATAAAVRWVLQALGWGGAGVALQVAGVLVAFVVDAAVFVLVVKVLAGQSPPWPDLRGGAVIAGVGIGVVRFLGTSVVAGSATRNPVLASFALVVTLLVWVNLISRIVLLAAAWTADPPPPGADTDAA